MPLRVDISASELKARKIINPDWYVFRLDNVTREKNKKGDAYNYVFRWIGESGDAKDVPITEWVSEKEGSIGSLGDIARSFGEEVNEDTGWNGDLESFIGGKCELKIKTGEFNGNPTNNIAGRRVYRP